MTLDSTPPEGTDVREDTGIYMSLDPAKLPPEVRVRVRLRMAENRIARMERTWGRIVWGVAGSAFAAVLVFATALLWIGAKGERVDADHARLDRLENALHRSGR